MLGDSNPYQKETNKTMLNKKHKPEAEDVIETHRKATIIFRWSIAISVFFIIAGFWELENYHGEFLSQSSSALKSNQTILLKSGMHFVEATLAIMFALSVRRKEALWLWSFSILGFILGIVIIWLEKLGYNLVSQRTLLRIYSFVPCMLVALVVAVIGTALSRKK